MSKDNTEFSNVEIFRDRINFFRQNALKRKKPFKEDQLNKPVSCWIKKERLLKEIGKEFTIILRTKGCSWALSNNGGCSMCGYIKDANLENVNPEQIKNQFNYALNDKIHEINKDKYNYILKIFNSGSFFDDSEIPSQVRRYIYKKIADIEKLKEFVIESRVEYITTEKLLEIKESLNHKYVEVAIGLETVNDYIRNNYINKGFSISDFKRVLKLCQELGIGVKAYLLFKPPFLNEQGAIDDCIDSIKELINLKVNSISINPVNVQKGTYLEHLWFQNRYRAPWYYSLFKCLKYSLNEKNLNSIRVLSDPSGAGTKRGIHNCLKRKCEENSKRKLRNFVLSQNLEVLQQDNAECDCKIKYKLEKEII